MQQECENFTLKYTGLKFPKLINFEDFKNFINSTN